MSMSNGAPTPTEIDTQLANLYDQSHSIAARIESAENTIRWAAGARRDSYTRRWTKTLDECLEATDLLPWDAKDHAEALADRTAALFDLDANLTATAVLNAQYTGWTRFFVVPGGHIHQSMSCSTCNNGVEPTRFGWLPQLSGQSEAEAVAEQGPLLCTVCFPSAPVEWTNGREVEAQARKDARCPGSGKYVPAATGRAASRYVRCPDCGKSGARTGTGLVRAHKPK